MGTAQTPCRVLWMGPGEGRGTPVSPQPAGGDSLGQDGGGGGGNAREGKEDSDVGSSLPAQRLTSAESTPRALSSPGSHSHRQTHILHLEPQGSSWSLTYCSFWGEGARRRGRWWAVWACWLPGSRVPVPTVVSPAAAQRLSSGPSPPRPPQQPGLEHPHAPEDSLQEEKGRRLQMAQPPTPRDLSSSLYLCLPHTARDTKPAGLARDLGVCGGPGIRASPPRGAKRTGRAGAAGPHSRPVLRLCLGGSIRAWPLTPGQAGAAGTGLVLGILNTPAPLRGS